MLLRLGKHYQKIILLGFLGLILINLTACSNSQHRKSVITYIQSVKSKKPKPLPPLPEIKNYQAPKYDVSNLRSPFEPSMSQMSGLKRMKEPLEKFSLDSLHLVGIINRDSTDWALIAAPDGKIYQVSIKGYIGQNNGQVVGIHKGHIDIAETIMEGNNKIEHHSKLTLWTRAAKAAAPKQKQRNN